jgi:starvation-inducible DNA-binding protein
MTNHKIQNPNEKNLGGFIMSTTADLTSQQQQDIAKGLAVLLADSYTLYLKTHNYHWNVRGPMFQTLHLMFEQHYTELATAVDLIAERIRALEVQSPGSYAEFGKLTSIKEAVGPIKAQEMIRQLLGDHQTVARTAKQAFPAAEKASDQATMDLLTQRMQLHEKTAWMLRSLLEE